VRPWLLPSAGINLKLIGGAIAGLATWGRWAALNEAPISVVLALNLLSVPLVLLLAPLLGSGGRERVHARTWIGGGLIVCGALVLIVAD
jgi:uncharacterized membrane protein